MTVKERLLVYLKHKGISLTAIGEAIGVSPAYVTSMRKSIQPDKIKKIASVYSDLNIIWFLFEEGEMLIPDTGGMAAEPAAKYRSIAEEVEREINRRVSEGLLFYAGQVRKIEEEKMMYAKKAVLLEERIRILELRQREITPGLNEEGLAGTG